MVSAACHMQLDQRLRKIPPRCLGSGCETVLWSWAAAYGCHCSAEVIPHGSQGSIPAAKRFKANDPRPWSGTEASPTAGRAVAGDPLWTPTLSSTVHCSRGCISHAQPNSQPASSVACSLHHNNVIVSSQLVVLADIHSATCDLRQRACPARGRRRGRSGRDPAGSGHHGGGEGGGPGRRRRIAGVPLPSTLSADPSTHCCLRLL